MGSRAAVATVLHYVGAPLVVAGALALSVALAARGRGWRRVQAATSAGGASSLTGYLGESVVASLTFCGYGMGLVNRVSPAASLLFAVVVWAGLEAAMRSWRRRFRHGPVEWLLRGVTYGRLPALRRAPAAPSTSAASAGR